MHPTGVSGARISARTIGRWLPDLAPPRLAGQALERPPSKSDIFLPKEKFSSLEDRFVIPLSTAAAAESRQVAARVVENYVMSQVICSPEGGREVQPKADNHH